MISVWAFETIWAFFQVRHFHELIKGRKEMMEGHNSHSRCPLHLLQSYGWGTMSRCYLTDDCVMYIPLRVSLLHVCRVRTHYYYRQHCDYYCSSCHRISCGHHCSCCDCTCDSIHHVSHEVITLCILFTYIHNECLGNLFLPCLAVRREGSLFTRLLLLKWV